MQADEVDDDESAQAFAEPAPTGTVPIDGPAAARPEQVKTCCVCGLDVSQKQRHKDRAGRYWCQPCHEFAAGADKAPGMAPCPDCGRSTRGSLMVEQAGERVCPSCHELYTAESEHRRARKAAATDRPEPEIRKLIRKLMTYLIAAAAVILLLTLYRFGLLFVPPSNSVLIKILLYLLGFVAAGLGIAVAIQYVRIDLRKRVRQAEYDKMLRSAANQILALDEDSHTMGISESPEPLRRRVERAVARVEACAGQGVSGAGEIIDSLSKKGNPAPLIEFLLAQRPNTTDTVARNREIATISYLQGNWPIATSAITAVLLRLQYDQDAMTRQALICFRTGQFDQAKKMFKRVVNIAREKNSEIDSAAAYSNLGMLHMMLNEIGDAKDRYNHALASYKRLSREDGQADCLANLGLIAYKLKNGSEADSVLREAMAINKRRKRREGLATCCSLLGVILLEKEASNLKEAESLLNQAAQLNLELGRMGGVATAYGNLGLVRVKRHDLKGAWELLLKAKGIYQRINQPRRMAKIQDMLKTVSAMTAKAAKK